MFRLLCLVGCRVCIQYRWCVCWGVCRLILVMCSLKQLLLQRLAVLVAAAMSWVER
jgi:hypothetical protein